MISLDSALDIIGTIKSFKRLGKIEVPVDIETLKQEEDILYGGPRYTSDERAKIFEKAETYYAPILKKYYATQRS